MKAPTTYNELCALLPDAAVEELDSTGELVIFTGLKLVGDHTTGKLEPMTEEDYDL